MIVAPSVVIEDVAKYKIDQIVVFARIGNEVAAWSSHSTEDMVELIDDVEDALENDTIMDPEDEDGE
jgi:hypothetical protein